MLKQVLKYRSVVVFTLSLFLFGNIYVRLNDDNSNIIREISLIMHIFIIF